MLTEAVRSFRETAGRKHPGILFQRFIFHICCKRCRRAPGHFVGCFTALLADRTLLSFRPAETAQPQVGTNCASLSLSLKIDRLEPESKRGTDLLVRHRQTQSLHNDDAAAYFWNSIIPSRSRLDDMSTCLLQQI